MSLTGKEDLQRSLYCSPITLISTVKRKKKDLNSLSRTLKTQKTLLPPQNFHPDQSPRYWLPPFNYHTFVKDWYNGSSLALISSQRQLSIAIYYYVNTDSTLLISNDSTWKGSSSTTMRIQNQMLILAAWNFKLEGNVMWKIVCGKIFHTSASVHGQN